jgi:hypothetical protein
MPDIPERAVIEMALQPRPYSAIPEPLFPDLKVQERTLRKEARREVAARYSMRPLYIALATLVGGFVLTGLTDEGAFGALAILGVPIYLSVWGLRRYAKISRQARHEANARWAEAERDIHASYESAIHEHRQHDLHIVTERIAMTQNKYFDSQVFEQDSEITESEAKALGIYVRAFIDDHGHMHRAEVVRDHQVTEVVYHGVEGDLDTALREQHRAAYPGVPFQITGAPVATEQGQERRKERYDAGGTLTAVVIEVLDDRGELLTEFRRDPHGVLTSRTEYEYDEQGELAWAREYDGQGRLVDEYYAGE